MKHSRFSIVVEFDISDTTQFAANEKPAFVFIGNLALADFLVGIVQTIAGHVHHRFRKDWNSYA